MINVLRRVRYHNREQRKLLFSLATNFLTRVPGVVGFLWFLPLLKAGLRNDQFAELLGSLSLGIAVTFLAGGFNTVGRRVVGECYSRADLKGESDGFLSVVIAQFACLVLAILVVVGYYGWWCRNIVAMTIATTVPICSFLSLFNDIRTAYNEQYVNALLLTVLQSAFFVGGFLFVVAQQNIYLAAVVITGPFFFSSLFTAVLLLWDRPHLLRGQANMVWYVIRLGTSLAIADGLLMASLNLGVVWLQSSSTSETAAWFATNVRIFQTFLTPIGLMLIPVASYLRILWHSKTPAKRQILAKVILASGALYGLLAGLALPFASQYYTTSLMDMPFRRDGAIFFLFAAIVAYRSYSSIAYVILDEATHLSLWTTTAVIAAITLTAFTGLTLDAISAINTYSLLTSLLIGVVMIWNGTRVVRGISRP